MTRSPRSCAASRNRWKSWSVAVGGVNPVEIGDVVAVVLQRRGIDRQEPQAGHAQLAQVVQLLGQPGEVADAVAVAVEERLHVHLVEDRVLVPVLHAALPIAGRRGRDAGRVTAARSWGILDSARDIPGRPTTFGGVRRLSSPPSKPTESRTPHDLAAVTRPASLPSHPAPQNLYPRTLSSAREPHEWPRGEAGGGGETGVRGGSVGFDGGQDTRMTTPNLGGRNTEVSRGTAADPCLPAAPGRDRGRLMGCTRLRASGGRGPRRRSRSSRGDTRDSRADHRRGRRCRAASGTRRGSGRRRRGRPPGARCD